MSFFDDVARGLSNPVSWMTGGLAAPFVGRNERKKEQAQQDRMNQITQGRYDLLQEGLRQGREKGEQLTGQSQEQTGTDVQSIVSRKRELASSPSRAESFILSQGQQQERRARSAGASDAQQRQIALSSAQQAGIQGDVDRERRLQSFQDIVGNIMSTQSSLEPAYGQLSLSSQYIAPEQREQGLLGDLFEGLGL